MMNFKKLGLRIGHRGAFLLFLSLLDFLYGYGMLVTPVKHLKDVLPFHTWGFIWIIAGIVLLIGSFVKRDRIAFGVAATLKAAWAAQWIMLTVYDETKIHNAWMNVVLWAAFSGLVVVVSTWPEVRPMWRHGRLNTPERIE